MLEDIEIANSIGRPLVSYRSPGRFARLLVFIVVLVLHLTALVIAVKDSQHFLLPLASKESPILLMYLDPRNPEASTQQSVPNSSKKRVLSAKASPNRAAPILIRPTVGSQENGDGGQPKIDWDNEAHVAAQNAIAKEEIEARYRDLSKLSPAQLRWIKENSLVPARPGIPWKYRRVEIVEGGLPIIHINDHCVAVQLAVAFMVFCKIGHIEPNGQIFDHMHDPN